MLISLFFFKELRVTTTLGTINGTVITFSTSVSFNSENTTFRDISFASNGTFAISYRKNNGYAAIRIGTLIGSTITLGTEVILSSVTSGLSKVAFDPADDTKLILLTQCHGHLYCKVGTVSGTGVNIWYWVFNIVLPQAFMTLL